MIDQIRTLLLIRDEPELRQHRTHIARGVTIAFAVLLAAFLVGDIIQYTLLGSDADYNFGFDLMMMGLLAAMVWVSWYCIQRGETIIAGYILSISIFLSISISLFLFPTGLLLFSPALVIPIMIASSIIGDLTVYALALAEMIVLIIAWVHARDVLNSSSPLFISEYGFMFFLVELSLLVSVTALMHLMSRTIRRTVLDLHSQSDKMAHLAHTDPLTGLSNRRHLVEELRREFDRAGRYQRPLSLAYIDLDGFKSINDHFGHLFGDEVLRSSALAMRAVLRSTDLLARIGGDEFAVLLPETPITDAMKVIGKLRKSVSANGKRLGPAVPDLTFCAGISELRPDDPSVDALLNRADDAVYMAKSAGNGESRTQIDIDQLPLFEQE